MIPDIGAIATKHIDNAALQASVRSVYEAVDREIEANNPRCTNRGHCCNFKSYGHRLYVSTVELSHFAAARRTGLLPTDPATGHCPYQIDGVCTARDERPLGCRVFFCESETEAWPNAIYESALARLQAVSAEHGVEYRYVEWLSALASLPSEGDATVNVPTTAERKIDPLSLPVIKSR